LLVVKNCFSRKTYLEPLLSATSVAAVAGFKKIFARIGTYGQLMQTDDGGEFTAIHSQKYFKSIGMKHFITYSTTKSSMAERAIQVVRGYIQKWFTYTGGQRYIDIIPQLEKKINGTYNRSIGMSPDEVNKRTEYIVSIINDPAVHVQLCMYVFL